MYRQQQTNNYGEDEVGGDGRNKKGWRNERGVRFEVSVVTREELATRDGR